MAANVITVESQAGSSGATIAQLVALRLGYTYYDWEVVARAASLAGVCEEAILEAERWPSFGQRLMKALVLTTPEPRGFNVMDADPRAVECALSRHFTPHVEAVVKGLARAGNCVIVGHAAQVVLRDSNAFRVLVRGDLAARAERTASQENVSLATALAHVRTADSQRSRFFKHVHNVNWLDPSLYNLTLDTDELANQAAADIIVEVAGVVSAAAAPAR